MSDKPKSIVDDIADIGWRLSELERERQMRTTGEPPVLRWAPCPNCHRRVNEEQEPEEGEPAWWCDACDTEFHPTDTYKSGEAPSGMSKRRW